jgi:hypothetical protein
MLLLFCIILQTPVFDTGAIIQSAGNMKTALVNIGYYRPEVTYTFDTVMHRKAQKRIITNYSVTAGKRTLLIQWLTFLKARTEELALSTRKESPLQKNSPVTKVLYSRSRKTC